MIKLLLIRKFNSELTIIIPYCDAACGGLKVDVDILSAEPQAYGLVSLQDIVVSDANGNTVTGDTCRVKSQLVGASLVEITIWISSKIIIIANTMTSKRISNPTCCIDITGKLLIHTAADLPKAVKLVTSRVTVKP